MLEAYKYKSCTKLLTNLCPNKACTKHSFVQALLGQRFVRSFVSVCANKAKVSKSMQNDTKTIVTAKAGLTKLYKAVTKLCFVCVLTKQSFVKSFVIALVKQSIAL